jgi:hypothetical protein
MDTAAAPAAIGAAAVAGGDGAVIRHDSELPPLASGDVG